MSKAKIFFITLAVAFVFVFGILIHEYKKFIDAPRVEPKSNGERIYIQRCAACHGPTGKGTYEAPDLTDAIWKNGTGTVLEISDITKNGVMQNGMPAWKNVLSTKDIEDVSVYVFSLKNQSNTKNDSTTKKVN